jgi:hypothetical protein
MLILDVREKGEKEKFNIIKYSITTDIISTRNNLGNLTWTQSEPKAEDELLSSNISFMYKKILKIPNGSHIKFLLN